MEYRPEFQKAWLSPQYWGLWFLLGLLWLLKWMPWWIRSAASWPFVILVYMFSGKRRRIARINLVHCFPDKSKSEREKILRQYFYFKVRVVFDYGVLWWGSDQRVRRLISIKNEEHYQQAQTTGKSIIVLTCHTAAVEYGGVRLSMDYPATSVAKILRNPLLDYYLQYGRKRAGAIIFDRGAGLKPVMKMVRQDHYLYYIPDEDHGGSNSVFAKLFDVQTSTLNSLGRLAKLCDAVVVPGVCYYESGKGKYVMHLMPVDENFSDLDKQQSAEQMNKIFEKMIPLALPQYMWGMKMFNRRPDSEKNFYD